MERRLTARGERRRQELLEAATDAFAAHGYHQTSVADVCEKLGVAKGVFYWYFESKEALFLEVLARAQQDLRDAQGAAAEEPDPLLRLEKGIRSSLAWLESHRQVLAIFQLAATDDGFLGPLRAGEEAMAHELAGHLKEAIVAGRIPDGDPQVLAYAVLGAIDALARTFLGREGAWDEGVAETAIAFCLGGLLAERRAVTG